MHSKKLDRKSTKIFFRIFPTEGVVWDHVKILDDHKTVYIRCLQELAKSKETVVPTFWTFENDYVFYNETQKEIYDHVISDTFSNLSQGRDAIITAYGQTGTGKSLTIAGLHNTYHDRGILPRIVTDLFEMKRKITADESKKMCFQLSFVEVSKTTVHDLLKPYPTNVVNSFKEITTIKVKNEDEALTHIFMGEGRKELAKDSSYPSNLYTSICTFYINTKYSKMQSQQFQQCKLHVIDFAGSDTVGNISCLFKKPQDIGSANLAKTQLEQFFLVLSSNISEFIKVKYRLNPIIQYLGNSLSKSSVLRFIGHIRVSREDLMITISMLRFGELIGGLKCAKYEINIESEHLPTDKIINLQNELVTLKEDINYNSILLNENSPLSFSADRFAHVQRTINDYLQDKITELTVLNVCEINIALEMLKLMYKKSERKNKETSSSKNKLASSSQKLIYTSRSARMSSSSFSKKTPSEKKLRTTSAPMKASTSKTNQSEPPTGSQVVKPRASNSSVGLRRSLSNKANSLSSVSKEKSKSKFSSLQSVYSIPVDIPPEYGEAWEMYKLENRERCEQQNELFTKAESDAKTAYKAYLQGMDELREITKNINQMKNDILLAQMTREFQNVINYTNIPSELEKCYTNQLVNIEKELVEKRETVLSKQAMLKVSLNICKELKNDLKESFENYCKEKYQMPLYEDTPEDTFGLKNLSEEVEEEENEESVLLSDHSEAEKFKQFQALIAKEQKKKKLYQMKHREWTFY